MIARSAAAAPPVPMSATHHKLEKGPGTTAVNVACFRGASGVAEWHFTVIPREAGCLDDHLREVHDAYRAAVKEAGLDESGCVFRRLFCSDIANQAEVLRQHPLASQTGPAAACAVSLVGQPPSAAAKVALWAVHLHDPAGPLLKRREGNTLALQRGSMEHLWTTGMIGCGAESVDAQTRAIFAGYVARLGGRGLTLADHVVRTWLFQPYIDLDYREMVAARRELFTDHGLTADTHYIASTGIAGGHDSPETRVFMDAYAVGGLVPGQVDYLTALDHLGPTSDYGVTFERATAVSYRDRRQVYISGTASINPRGEILHPGDVVRQLDRTLRNIDSLLRDGGASLADMLVFLVYLRDGGDHDRILPALRERIGDAPMLIVTAPVCRPGWLIEIEGIAAVPLACPHLPAF